MSGLLVSASIFGIGLYGVLVRRDLVGVLASVEVMMAGPLLLLVSMGAGFGGGARIEAAGLLILVFAASEAAVGLALVVALARRGGSMHVDDLTEVRG
jgi:NADH:ubiquinone oxidoreductase subunit K